MIIFPIIILLSLVLYVYYKVAIIRSNDILKQLYLNSKGKIFLGSFILFFGINQYLYYETRIALYIAIVFILMGGAQIMYGIKNARHYHSEIKIAERS